MGTKSARWAAVLGAGCLLAAGCSSSHSKSLASSSSTTGSTAANNPGSSSTPPASTAQATGSGLIKFSSTNTYKANVDRTGQTILIGFSNDEGTTYSVPQYRIGAEAAVKWINSHGGVNGAQIKLDECKDDDSPEGAINCANKFVQDHVTIASYGSDLAIDSALPIYDGAGIPEIAWVDDGGKQRASKNYTGLGDADGTYSEGLEALKNVGVNKLAFLIDQSPTAGPFITLMEGWAKLLGIQMVSVSQLDPANPDWSAAIEAGAAKGADAELAAVDEQSCVSFVNTALHLAYKGMIVPSGCSTYIKTLGQASVGTVNFIQSYPVDMINQAPPTIKANLKTYETAMQQAGASQYTDSFATSTFSFMMDLKTLLETIPAGPIDAASINKARSANMWLPSFDEPDFNCGLTVWPQEPGYCSGALLPAKVAKENGQLVRVPLQSANYGWVYDTKLAQEVAH